MNRLIFAFCLCIIFPSAICAQVDSSRNKAVTWTRELQEVTIRETRKPDTVVSSPVWMIRDYHFRGDSLYLLTWEKNPDKCMLRLFNRAGKELAARKLNDTPLGFFKDVYDIIYLECKAETYRIEASAGAIQLQTIDERFFNAAIRPTVAATDDHFFISSFHPYRPDFAFLHSDRKSHLTDTLLEVRDQHLYDLYYSEYKFLPFKTQCAIKRQSRETGRSKYEIAAEVSGFTQSLWWRKLYSPLMKCDSAVYIFDHYRDSLFCFNTTGELQSQQAMVFHKDKTYKQEIVQDEFTKELYSLHFRGGKYSLSPINLATAQEGEPMQLHYRYVENIRVRNGKVFYMYRPFESSQNTFLYSELLPSGQLAGR